MFKSDLEVFKGFVWEKGMSLNFWWETRRADSEKESMIIGAKQWSGDGRQWGLLKH